MDNVENKTLSDVQEMLLEQDPTNVSIALAAALQEVSELKKQVGTLVKQTGTLAQNSSKVTWEQVLENPSLYNQWHEQEKARTNIGW